MRQIVNRIARAVEEINPANTHYYLDHLSKRFCTMRCRLAYKAERQDWNEAPELHV